MRYLHRFALDVIEAGYIFFPGEVWLFLISVMLTLLLIWYVEKF